MLFKKLALSSFCVAVSVNCHAQEDISNTNSWYIGAAITNQSFEIKNSGMNKSTNVGYSVFGGYNFTPWFALEASVSAADVDKNNQSNLRTAGVVTASFTPKFTFVLNDFASLYLKAGVSSVVYLEEYNATRRYSDEYTWSGVGSVFGLGSEFKVTDNLKLRVSYDQYRAKLEEVDNYAYDINVKLFQTGVGLYYQF